MSRRGSEGWRELYLAQAEHKLAQIELMIRYTQSSECRMLGLVRHFGDYADAAEALRHLRFLRARRMHRAKLPSGVRCRAESGGAYPGARLKKSGRKATGRLHSEVFADYSLDRDSLRTGAGRHGPRRMGGAVRGVVPAGWPARGLPAGRPTAAGRRPVKAQCPPLR